MTAAFVARQPIDNRRHHVAGYELLFRNGQASEPLVVKPERATATVVLNSFTEIGLDRVVGPHTAWVNVSREFVLDGLARTLPPDRVGLEILEDQLLDDLLIARLGELKSDGYRLALDDFRYSPGAEPLLGLVDVVKLDLLDLGPPGP